MSQHEHFGLHIRTKQQQQQQRSSRNGHLNSERAAIGRLSCSPSFIRTDPPSFSLFPPLTHTQYTFSLFLPHLAFLQSRSLNSFVVPAHIVQRILTYIMAQSQARRNAWEGYAIKMGDVWGSSLALATQLSDSVIVHSTRSICKWNEGGARVIYGVGV